MGNKIEGDMVNMKIILIASAVVAMLLAQGFALGSDVASGVGYQQLDFASKTMASIKSGLSSLSNKMASTLKNALSEKGTANKVVGVTKKALGSINLPSKSQVVSGLKKLNPVGSASAQSTVQITAPLDLKKELKGPEVKTITQRDKTWCKQNPWKCKLYGEDGILWGKLWGADKVTCPASDIKLQFDRFRNMNFQIQKYGSIVDGGSWTITHPTGKQETSSNKAFQVNLADTGIMIVSKELPTCGAKKVEYTVTVLEPLHIELVAKQDPEDPLLVTIEPIVLGKIINSMGYDGNEEVFESSIGYKQVTAGSLEPMKIEGSDGYVEFNYYYQDRSMVHRFETYGKKRIGLSVLFEVKQNGVVVASGVQSFQGLIEVNHIEKKEADTVFSKVEIDVTDHVQDSGDLESTASENEQLAQYQLITSVENHKIIEELVISEEVEANLDERIDEALVEQNDEPEPEEPQDTEDLLGTGNIEPADINEQSAQSEGRENDPDVTDVADELLEQKLTNEALLNPRIEVEQLFVSEDQSIYSGRVCFTPEVELAGGSIEVGISNGKIAAADHASMNSIIDSKDSEKNVSITYGVLKKNTEVCLPIAVATPNNLDSSISVSFSMNARPMTRSRSAEKIDFLVEFLFKRAMELKIYSMEIDSNDGMFEQNTVRVFKIKAHKFYTNITSYNLRLSLSNACEISQPIQRQKEINFNGNDIETEVYVDFIPEIGGKVAHYYDVTAEILDSNDDVLDSQTITILNRDLFKKYSETPKDILTTEEGFDVIQYSTFEMCVPHEIGTLKFDEGSYKSFENQREKENAYGKITFQKANSSNANWALTELYTQGERIIGQKLVDSERLLLLDKQFKFIIDGIMKRNSWFELYIKSHDPTLGFLIDFVQKGYYNETKTPYFYETKFMESVGKHYRKIPGMAKAFDNIENELDTSINKLASEIGKRISGDEKTKNYPDFILMDMDMFYQNEVPVIKHTNGFFSENALLGKNYMINAYPTARGCYIQNPKQQSELYKSIYIPVIARSASSNELIGCLPVPSFMHNVFAGHTGAMRDATMGNGELNESVLDEYRIATGYNVSTGKWNIFKSITNERLSSTSMLTNDNRKTVYLAKEGSETDNAAVYSRIVHTEGIFNRMYDAQFISVDLNSNIHSTTNGIKPVAYSQFPQQASTLFRDIFAETASVEGIRANMLYGKALIFQLLDATFVYDLAGIGVKIGGNLVARTVVMKSAARASKFQKEAMKVMGAKISSADDWKYIEYISVGRKVPVFIDSRTGLVTISNIENLKTVLIRVLGRETAENVFPIISGVSQNPQLFSELIKMAIKPSSDVNGVGAKLSRKDFFAEFMKRCKNAKCRSENTVANDRVQASFDKTINLFGTDNGRFKLRKKSSTGSSIVLGKELEVRLSSGTNAKKLASDYKEGMEKMLGKQVGKPDQVEITSSGVKLRELKSAKEKPEQTAANVLHLAFLKRVATKKSVPQGKRFDFLRRIIDSKQTPEYILTMQDQNKIFGQSDTILEIPITDGIYNGEKMLLMSPTEAMVKFKEALVNRILKDSNLFSLLKKGYSLPADASAGKLAERIFEDIPIYLQYSPKVTREYYLVVDDFLKRGVFDSEVAGIISVKDITASLRDGSVEVMAKTLWYATDEANYYVSCVSEKCISKGKVPLVSKDISDETATNDIVLQMSSITEGDTLDMKITTASGEVFGVLSFDLELDSVVIAPTVNITVLGTKTEAYVNDGIKFAITANDSDDIAQIIYETSLCAPVYSGGATIVGGKETVTASCKSPGILGIRAKAQDKKGTWSEWVYSNITVKSIPTPIVRILSPTRNFVYIGEQAGFTVEASDEVGLESIQIMGSCDAGKSWGKLPPAVLGNESTSISVKHKCISFGVMLIKAMATNAKGGTSDWKTSDEISVISNLVPLVSITQSKVEEYVFVNDNVAYTIKAEDDNGIKDITYQIKCGLLSWGDAIVVNKMLHWFEASCTKDSTLKVRAKATDNDGRESNWVYAEDVKIVKNDEPEISLTDVDFWNSVYVFENVQFKIKASDKYGGLNSIDYSVSCDEGKTWVPYSIVDLNGSKERIEPVTHQCTTPGKLWLKALTTDELGAKSDFVFSSKITVKANPAPEIKVKDDDSDNKVYVGEKVKFTLDSSDDYGGLDGADYSVTCDNGKTWERFTSVDYQGAKSESGVVEHLCSSVGTMQLKATAVDKFNALSSVVFSDKITVQVNTAPSVTVTDDDKDNKVKTDENVKFTVKAEDSDGIKLITYQTTCDDGRTWGSDEAVEKSSMSVDVKCQQSGKMKLRAKAEDMKGRLADWKTSEAIIVENRNPVLELLSDNAALLGVTEGTPVEFTIRGKDQDGGVKKFEYQLFCGDLKKSGSMMKIELDSPSDDVTVSINQTCNVVGKMLLKARVMDTQGAVSEWKSSSKITVNKNLAPTVVVSDNDLTNSVYLKQVVIFTIEASDDDGITEVTYKISCDGGKTYGADMVLDYSGEKSIKKEISHSCSNVGVMMLHTVAKDRKGKSSEAVTSSNINVKANPIPRVSVKDDESDNKVYLNEKVRFTLEASDDYGGLDQIDYWLTCNDGTTWASYTGKYNGEASAKETVEHSCSTTGTLQMKAKAFDKHGAESDLAFSDKVKVQVNSEPSVTITDDESDNTVEVKENVKFTIMASDDDGLNWIKYATSCNNGDSWMAVETVNSASKSVTIDCSSPGKMKVKAYARDNTGLETAWSYSETVTVKEKANTAPRMTVSDDDLDNEVDVGVSVKFTLEGKDDDDNLNYIEYKITCNDGSSWDWQFTEFSARNSKTNTVYHSCTSAGTMQLKARAYDTNNAKSGWEKSSKITVKAKSGSSSSSGSSGSSDTTKPKIDALWAYEYNGQKDNYNYPKNTNIKIYVEVSDNKKLDDLKFYYDCPYTVSAKEEGGSKLNIDKKTYSKDFTFRCSSKGTVEYWVTITDTAGNEAGKSDYAKRTVKIV